MTRFIVVNYPFGFHFSVTYFTLLCLYASFVTDGQSYCVYVYIANCSFVYKQFNNTRRLLWTCTRRRIRKTWWCSWIVIVDWKQLSHFAGPQIPKDCVAQLHMLRLDPRSTHQLGRIYRRNGRGSNNGDFPFFAIEWPLNAQTAFFIYRHVCYFCTFVQKKVKKIIFGTFYLTERRSCFFSFFQIIITMSSCKHWIPPW